MSLSYELGTCYVGYNSFDCFMQVEDAETIVNLTEEMDSIDGALLQEAVSLVKELNKVLDRFELTQLLSGPYDKEGAVLYITAGAGGTDAQVIVTSHTTRRRLTGFIIIIFSPSFDGIGSVICKAHI